MLISPQKSWSTALDDTSRHWAVHGVRGMLAGWTRDRARQCVNFGHHRSWTPRNVDCFRVTSEAVVASRPPGPASSLGWRRCAEVRYRPVLRRRQAQPDDRCNRHYPGGDIRDDEGVTF